jgi:hypothetical protein
MFSWWAAWAATVSGTGITGGGSGHAAILAHAGGVCVCSVRYETRLGDLKESCFILFFN